jgi:L-iditol 2-dehydrogenase
MKAAVLLGPGRVDIRDRPKPEVKGKTDVLVRVATVGICGSDLHYFSEEVIGDTVMKYHVVLGHECAGVVEDTGRGVTRVQAGDRVAVEPAISCGACDQCRAGRPNTCRTIEFLGHPKERPGALAEFIVMPEENCLPIPNGMTFTQATLAEPLSIAVHAVDLAGGVEGRTAAVLGSGPIGMCVGLALGNRGAAPPFVTDKVEDRLEAAARRSGAGWTGNPLRLDVVRDILEREPHGLDFVFECCGKQEALDQAVELLKPGGTLMLVGIPLEQRVSFNISRLRRREIRLQNVRRQNRCMEKALEMIGGRAVDIDFLATHTFPLEETQRAFDTALHYRDGVLKALVGVGPR